MEQFKNFSSWREERITVQAGECYAMNFIDTKPNMFYIQNPNSTKLRIGISKIPTQKNYEFTIDENASQTIGRPTSTSYLYILNPSSNHADITIYSINEKFDLNVLKNLNVNVSGATFESDGIVKGFESGASLPSGSNTIGLVGLRAEEKALLNEISVDVETYLNDISKDTGNMLAIKNHVTGTYENTFHIMQMLTGEFVPIGAQVDRINAIINSINTSNELLRKIGNISIDSGSPIYLNNVIEFEYSATSDCKLHFSWLFFDGSGTANIKRVTTSETGETSEEILFTILEGEQFTEMEFELSVGQSIIIESDKPLYRIKYYTY